MTIVVIVAEIEDEKIQPKLDDYCREFVRPITVEDLVREIAEGNCTDLIDSKGFFEPKLQITVVGPPA